MSKAVFLASLIVGLCVTAPADAQPVAWEAPLTGPSFGGNVGDVATAIGEIDAGAGSDLVVAAASRQADGSVRIAYRVGWNLDRTGAATSWSGAVDAPALAARTSGVGIAIGQIDADTAPDLILIARDVTDPNSNRLIYRVGWNVGADGSPRSWSDPQVIDNVPTGEGAAVALGQIDAGNRPDILIGTYEPVPDRPDRFRYRIGWNLAATGAAASWSTWRGIAGVGDSVGGVSAILAPLQGQARPEMLFAGRSTAAQIGEFRFRLAEDISEEAVPTSWAARPRLAGMSADVRGATLALVDLDGPGQGTRPDLLVGAYNPAAAGGTGALLYRVGRNWDPTPPRLSLNHRPLHPAVGETVTYTATAEDPDGFTIEIIVNGQVAATCATSPCVFAGVPVRDAQRGTVAYEARVRDAEGRTLSSGQREHQMGAVVAGVFPSGAVPIWVTGPVGERIDIVFLRDSDTYGGAPGLANFQRDVAAVLDRTYAADEAVGAGLGRFNFWYLTRTATAGSRCRRTVPPEYWAFGDAGAIVHTDAFRDCANGGVFSSEPFEIHTFMHETGHAVFRLSDLYRNAGGLSEEDVWPNVYRTRQSCEADARLHGWPIAACTAFPGSGGTWYRIDRVTSVMGTCGGPYPRCVDDRFAFDRGSRRRIIWYLEGREQEPAPAALLARGAVAPGASLLIQFRPAGAAGLLPDGNTISVVEAEAPDELRIEGGLLVEYLDAGGAVVATYRTEDPRIGRVIDPPYGSEVLSEPSALRVPLVVDAAELRITPGSRAGARALAPPAPIRIALGPAIARFCANKAGSGLCVARSRAR